MIKRYITEDCRVGFDELNRLMLATKEGDHTTYTFIADVRNKTCALCLRGWEPTGKSLGDQENWRLIGEYVHESCLIRHFSFVQRAEIHDAICSAKLWFEKLVHIENRYWPKAYAESNMPWYQTTLRDHPITLTVGHRKRVIEIVLEGKELPWEQLRDLMVAENVTKEFKPTCVYIHAWGNKKMREYLVAFAGVIGEKTGPQ